MLTSSALASLRSHKAPSEGYKAFYSPLSPLGQTGLGSGFKRFELGLVLVAWEGTGSLVAREVLFRVFLRRSERIDQCHMLGSWFRMMAVSASTTLILWFMMGVLSGSETFSFQVLVAPKKFCPLQETTNIKTESKHLKTPRARALWGHLSTIAPSDEEDEKSLTPTAICPKAPRLHPQAAKSVGRPWQGLDSLVVLVLWILIGFWGLGFGWGLGAALLSRGEKKKHLLLGLELGSIVECQRHWMSGSFYYVISSPWHIQTRHFQLLRYSPWLYTKATSVISPELSVFLRPPNKKQPTGPSAPESKDPPVLRPRAL